MTSESAPEKLRLRPETLRSLAFGSISASYATLGTPLENDARVVKFTNTSDADVFISWDGTNNHEILPANSFVLIDIAANKQLSSICYITAYTQFYVKQVSGAPTIGAVYLSVYWA